MSFLMLKRTCIKMEQKNEYLADQNLNSFGILCPAYYGPKSFRCIFYRERSAALVASVVRSSRIRCEQQEPWHFAASANEQLQVTSQIPRVTAQHTPSCSGSSPTWPGGLGTGARPCQSGSLCSCPHLNLPTSMLCKELLPLF